MKTRRIAVICMAATSLALAGCAEPARQEAMVPGQIQPAANSRYANSISAVSGYGGEETNPMWTSEISSEAFQSALMESLKQAGLYSARGALRVRADILTVEQPMVGLDLKVVMTVRYNLIDAKGNIRFDRTIRSTYVAQFSEAFVAIERLKKANEGAARENIRQFLKALGVDAPGGAISAVS